MRTIATLLAAALSLTAAPALAQWSATQLEQIGEMMTARGLERISEPQEGSLDNGGTATVNLFLAGNGTTTLVAAVCDNDCADLDIAVYDPDGTELGADVKSDDIPIVRINPAKGGAYRVKVTMAVCASNPCGYSVVAYQQGA
jgi:hypothetical protein